MIRFILLLFVFLLNLTVSAQTALYMGENTFPADMIYSIENNIVYRHQNRVIKSEYLYIQGNKVYFRERRFSDDVKYTLGNGVIYRGITSEVLFTFSDGKLYQGDSTMFSSDVLYTFENGVIYKGNSTSSFDAVMSYTLNEQDDLLRVVMLILPY